MSVLWTKKVLANINKDKITLADQQLPSAKHYLFGEYIPSFASMQVELSRGLAKNWSVASKPRQQFFANPVLTKVRKNASNLGYLL